MVLYSSLQLALLCLTDRFTILNGSNHLHFLKDEKWLGGGSNSECISGSEFFLRYPLQVDVQRQTKNLPLLFK